ncbi:MAG: hypothetical protein ACJASF_001295, partial [Vicingaceae bacterium]
MKKKYTLFLAAVLLSFMGFAQTVTLPIAEDFELENNATSCTASGVTLTSTTFINDPNDADEWDVDNGGTSSSATGPSVDHKPGTSVGKYLYTETSGCNNNTANLQSTWMNWTTNSSVTVEAWYHMYGTSQGTMHFDIRKGINGAWQLDYVPSWTDNQDLWQLRSVLINDTTYVNNDSIQIRFRAITGSSFGSDMAIDDITVDQTPTCIRPSASSSNTITANSATVTWTEAATATSWRVEWDTAGYTAGTARNSVVVLTDTFLNVTGLMAQTAYDWKVQALCSPTDSSTLVANSFFTACNAVSAFPYSENFDGALINNVWDCWTVINADNDAETWIQSNTFITARSGTWTAHGMGNQNDHLISPQLVLPAGINMRMKVWDIVESATRPNDYSVLVSTTGTAIADFTDTLASYSVTNTTWTERTLDLSAYTGQTIYINMWQSFSTSSSWGFGLDDFLVEQTPNCLAPTASTETNLTATASTLNWIENGTATQWEVEWDTAGYTLGSGNSIIVNTDTFTTITALVAESTYDWYVRAICGVGDTSTWTFVSSFTTPCATAIAPFFDGFENHAVISGMNGVYNCWTATRQNTSNDWNVDNSGSTPSTGTGPAGPYAGTQYIYLEASGGTAGAEAEFISPFIDVNGLTTPIVEFYYHMFGDNRGGMGNLYVDLIDSGITTTIDSIINEQQANQNDPWLKRSIVLPATSGTIQISLRATRGTLSQWGDISVDDFSVIEAPSCTEPNALVTSSIGADSASIGWTENNTATQWEIEYGLLGFTPGSGTTAIVTSNPFSLTGLNSSTDYGWRVRSICGAADTSVWSSTSSFKTAFQCPVGAICATYTAGDITSDRGFTSLPGTSTCADSVVLAIPFGDRIDSMSAVYDMTATSAGNAWISEQRSWLYSPTLVAGEATITSGPALNSAGTASYSRTGLTFANGATGNVVVQMHAGRTFGGTACAAGINDIDNASWIVIAYHSAIPACLEPISVVATANSTDSATVTWSDTNGVTAPSYDVSYGTAGTPAGAGTVVTVTSSTAGIGGLLPGTAYDVYVRSNCGVGSSSPWSLVASFATFNGVPYFQNFEAFTTGSPVSEGWSNFKSTNPQWLVRQGTTPSSGSGTGPTVDHTVGTATGKYVFLETSIPGVAGNADTMYSAPIIVGATQNVLELSYWYHFFGATIGSLEAWVEDSSGALSQVGSIVGQQQALTTAPYLRAKHVVSGYANQQIRLVFVGVRGTSFTGDLAIDDVRLDVAPPAEIGITDILRPSSGCGLGADSIEVTITNFGANAQTGFNVGYSLNGVAITPETVSGTIAAGTSMNYTFSTPAALATSGNYNIVTYTLLTGDADTSNDTLGTSVNSFASVSTFPYSTSFETGNDSWFATGDASWELGVPAGFVIDTASNGTQAWVTDLNAAYGDGLDAFLTSPCFDFTGIANPAINLDIWYDIESQWDGAFLQATTDGGATWNTIGNTGDNINWYNDTSRVPVDNGYSALGDSWTGDGSVSGVNGSNGWITASHELDGLGGQATVQLRIVLSSDAVSNGDGLGVDNIEIYDRDPSYAIGILNTEDATGVADSLGTIAWTSGVVVGIDLDGNNGISFTIIDD